MDYERSSTTNRNAHDGNESIIRAIQVSVSFREFSSLDLIITAHSRVYGVVEALPAATTRADVELTAAAMVDGTRQQANIV